MARPRVFISSTYYDLKHVRASLDTFIDSLGFDSILSEKGDIPYSHELPLDESCYREIDTADIFVLIVGGRYGTAATGEDPAAERFASITKKEFLNAVEKDIPVFILVEAAVHAEYSTYMRNKGSPNITYAHVDSVNVFAFLEEILAARRNNPVQPFERVSDITTWLKEQWAGLFRDHLHRKANQRQLSTLSEQIKTLQDVAATLQRYLEEVVSKVSGENAAGLINAEKERLEESRFRALLENISLLKLLAQEEGANLDLLKAAILEPTTEREVLERLAAIAHDQDLADSLKSAQSRKMTAKSRAEINSFRQLLGRGELVSESNSSVK